MNKSHKVCILTSVHSPFDVRIFYKEATTLVKEGYRVVLIAQNENDQIVNHVRIISVPKPKNRFFRMFSITWNIFNKALREKADVYHIHDPELLPYAVLLKVITRKKIIYDIHENVKKQILNKKWILAPLRSLAALAYRIVEKISFNFIDKIIIAEDSYIENYAGRNYVVPVRNFPMRSFFLKEQGVGRRNPELVELIYAGGVTKLRGALEMVGATGILVSAGHKVVTKLIGPVRPESLKDDLQSVIRDNGLTDRVLISGSIPYEEVCSRIAASDIGLCLLQPDPNYLESMPTKLFEYMAAGIPVVASNFPLWKEIIDGNRCGLTVDPMNPKEIAEAIEYLIKHPDERFEMGKNGRKAVEEKYNWENESKKLIKLYDELVSR